MNKTHDLFTPNFFDLDDDWLPPVKSPAAKVAEVVLSSPPPSPTSSPMRERSSSPGIEVITSQVNELKKLSPQEQNDSFWELTQKQGRSLVPDDQANSFLNSSTSLDQHFTRIRELGAGACGSVSLWSATTGQQIAIKELNFDLALLCDNDFEIGMALDHKNIVKVHHLIHKPNEWGETSCFMVMEYVDGTIFSPHYLTETERLKLFNQMAESTLHMLDRGVLPNDLKGSNMMVTAAGDWKWIDLGAYLPLNQVNSTMISYSASQWNNIAEQMTQGVGLSSTSQTLREMHDAAERFFIPISATKEEALELFQTHVRNLLAIANRS